MTELDSDKHRLPLCIQCIKWLMVLTNFAASFAGLILIAIGIFLCLKYVDYLSFENDISIGILIILFVTTAIFISAISLCGFFGFIKENRFLLLFFAFVGLFIFFSQFIVAFFTFAFKETIYVFIQNDFILSTNSSKVDTLKLWNVIHKNFECCGFNSPSDWKLKSQSLPSSCCKSNLKCPNELNPAYNNGCYETLVQGLSNNLTSIGIVMLIIVICQIFSILFSCLMANSIKKKNSIVKRKNLKKNYHEF